MSELNPWQRPPLSEWSICGMNHYHINGEKFVFVSMVKDGQCITEEGKDDKYLWNRLWHKAVESRPSSLRDNESKKALISESTAHAYGQSLDKAYLLLTENGHQGDAETMRDIAAIVGLSAKTILRDKVEGLRNNSPSKYPEAKRSRINYNKAIDDVLALIDQGD